MDKIKTPAYFINGQHRITISLIGAGGSGSLILTKLARLNEALIQLEHPGFYVYVVDFDIVEEHNVGRQMFTRGDIGAFKSDCLISKINHAFGYDWESKTEPFNHHDVASNIVISAVDNIGTRHEILDQFFKCNDGHDVRQPYFIIDCGNARDYGQVILTDYKNKLKNIYDLIPDWIHQDTKEQQGEGCSYAERLEEQDLFINDWVSLYVITIIKDLLFKKQIDYQGFFFNTSNYETLKIIV